MNDDNLNSHDDSIRRLLAEAVGPQSLRDAEIEAMLTSTKSATALSHEQRQRIVGKVGRLILAADSHETDVTSTAAPEMLVSRAIHHAPQPRLVMISTTDIPRQSNRKAAIASLLASLLALVSVVVLTSNTPDPSGITDNRRSETDTLRLDLQQRHAMLQSARYQMTAKPLPQAPAMTQVAVGDEISTGELERRRISLPEGSVLYVNSNTHVKIVNERRVEVTKGEVFIEVVPTVEPHGASQRVSVDAAAINSTHEQLPAASAVPLRLKSSHQLAPSPHWGQSLPSVSMIQKPT